MCVRPPFLEYSCQQLLLGAVVLMLGACSGNASQSAWQIQIDADALRPAEPAQPPAPPFSAPLSDNLTSGSGGPQNDPVAELEHHVVLGESVAAGQISSNGALQVTHGFHLPLPEHSVAPQAIARVTPESRP